MPGKTLLLEDETCSEPPASMRPQRNAGENGLTTDSNLLGDQGFNEAPAKCRGKQGPPGSNRRRPARFNEAPAKCRGKLPQRLNFLRRLAGLQ